MKVPIGIIRANVKSALREDLGRGDVHAAVAPDNEVRHGEIISRSDGVLCGIAWVLEAYRQVSEDVQVECHKSDGETIEPNVAVASIAGPVNVLLAVERTALNFLQLLSGTASRAQSFVKLVEHTQAKILDTRKTIPGLRFAQKYAVRIGGGTNHRIGLFDAFLIKENHIVASGGIKTAALRARKARPDLFLQVEVENLEELEQALNCDVDRIMLDNFSILQLREAVRVSKSYSIHRPKPVQLEASGGISESNVVQVAETGVDFISLGTLTKDIQSIDFSFRISV